MGCEGEGSQCQQAIENLYLFLDREIDTATHDDIQHHIDGCADCLNEYHLEQVVKMLVSRSCLEVAPPQLRDKVRFSIHQLTISVRGEPD